MQIVKRRQFLLVSHKLAINSGLAHLRAWGPKHGVECESEQKCQNEQEEVIPDGSMFFLFQKFTVQ